MNLILFFTYGVSLKTWDETGLIDREILLYRRLLNKGVRVTFITYGDSSDYYYQDKLGDIEIVPFYAYTKRPDSRKTRFLYSFLLPFILHKKIRQGDILKTNQMWGAWVVILAKMLYRKKVIVRCGAEKYRMELNKKHSSMYLFALKIFSKCIYKIADRVILPSNSSSAFVTEKFRINQDKITVFHNYIDIERFKPMDMVTNNSVLFIGRLSAQKNIFSLLDAITQTDYQLDIIGDGDLRSQIESYIKEHKIKANLLGRFPNAQLPEIINCYSVYILPSYYEGNPKTLLEAMACGTPVVGTNVEGIKEIIKNNENGLLCGTDAGAIRQAIIRLMNDKDLRDRLGKNARNFIMENCSLDRVVEKEYTLYKELVDENT